MKKTIAIVLAALMLFGCLAPPAQAPSSNATTPSQPAANVSQPPANATPAVNVTQPAANATIPPAQTNVSPASNVSTPAANVSPASNASALPANVTPPFPVQPLVVSGNLTFHFIDVGQGDAILVVLPSNKSFLVDAGTSKARYSLIDYLLAHGGGNMSFAVATHPDADHIGGMKDVLASFPATYYYFNGQYKNTITFVELIDLVNRHGISLKTARAGDVLLNESAVSVVVLHPQQPAPQSLPDELTNRYSIVLKVSYKDFCAILAGDVDEEGEAEILQARWQMGCQVLKVGHHGSAYSSSDAFLVAAQPKVAIISVGANNSYGHPEESILQKLLLANASIYRTDVHGTIQVTSNGSSYAVYPERVASNASAAPLSASSNCIHLLLAHFDAVGNDASNLNDEYVVFENLCQAEVSLLGWRMEDASGSKFRFPPYTILPRGTLSIHTGCGKDETPNVYWCRGDPVWNNDGDVIYLFDGSGLMAMRYAYGGAS